MAQFQWQFDAPTGTFKQHALSQRLYEAAVARSVTMDHVRPVEGFGKKMGENVTLTRISNIAEPTSANLIEGERIPEDSFHPLYHQHHRERDRAGHSVHQLRPGPVFLRYREPYPE